VQPQVDLYRQILDVRVASHFPGKPVQPQGTTLAARVPPRGMVVLDVRLGDDSGATPRHGKSAPRRSQNRLTRGPKQRARP
jgi:hypothetical protein